MAEGEEEYTTPTRVASPPPEEAPHPPTPTHPNPNLMQYTLLEMWNMIMVLVDTPRYLMTTRMRV